MKNNIAVIASISLILGSVFLQFFFKDLFKQFDLEFTDLLSGFLFGIAISILIRQFFNKKELAEVNKIRDLSQVQKNNSN